MNSVISDHTRFTPHDVVQDNFPSYPVFDIFSAFANLPTSQKLNLCDQLFHVGPRAAHMMVKKLWPQSTALDADRLIDMLKRRINKSLQV